MLGSLTNEQKKDLSRERQRAVREAWKEEIERVKIGQGTRDWTLSQQQELLQRGTISGYDGHHMKSVNLYPEFAGEAKNIQFLSEEEHLEAHQGNYHNPTYGYYDVEMRKMDEYCGDELKPAPIVELSECYYKNDGLLLIKARENYFSDNVSNIEKTCSESISYAKETYFESFRSTEGVDDFLTKKNNSETYEIGR